MEIKNLKDLKAEQLKVKMTYQAIESDWFNHLTPTTKEASAIMPLIAEPLLKKLNIPFLQNLLEILPSLNIKSFNQLMKPFQKKGKNKNNSNKSYKKLGRNLLAWQIVSLGVFVAGNIMITQKNKKQSK